MVKLRPTLFLQVFGIHSCRITWPGNTGHYCNKVVEELVKSVDSLSCGAVKHFGIGLCGFSSVPPQSKNRQCDKKYIEY